MAIEASRLQIAFTTAEGVGDRSFTPSVNDAITFSNGTGALGAQKVGKATVTLVAGAAVELDLTSSTDFTDTEGNAITFTKVKAIAFQTAAANAAAMVVGAAGLNDWDTLLNATGTLTFPPGTVAAFMTRDANGWAVTAGDILNIDGDGTDSIDVLILGEGSAA